MQKVRIEIFEGGAPSATIGVPIWLVTGATSLSSKIGGPRLQERVDLDQLAQMLKDVNACGRLLEIEAARSDRDLRGRPALILA